MMGEVVKIFGGGQDHLQVWAGGYLHGFLAAKGASTWLLVNGCVVDPPPKCRFEATLIWGGPTGGVTYEITVTDDEIDASAPHTEDLLRCKVIEALRFFETKATAVEV
jgi:hypothetical protein